MRTILQTKTYTKIIIASIALLLITNSANSQTSKLKITFVGNSITAGVYNYGEIDEQVSYATQFSKLVEEYVDTLEIFNAGVSGCTLTKNTSSPIWTQTKFKNSLTWFSDICLIALGTNDSKPSRLNVVKSDFYNDYQDMIDTFKHYNPNVTFITCLPPPIWDGHPYSTTDPHNDTILVKYTIPLIDSIAKANHFIVVDFHTPFVDSLHYFDDKLHPNKAGHKKMAKILFNKFIEEGLIDTVTIPTDIIEIKTENKLILFPNPSKNTCIINIPDEFSSPVDIYVFDINGSTVLFQKNIKEKNYSLDISDLNKGLHYILLKADEKRISDKLVIN